MKREANVIGIIIRFETLSTLIRIVGNLSNLFSQVKISVRIILDGESQKTGVLHLW